MGVKRYPLTISIDDSHDNKNTLARNENKLNKSYEYQNPESRKENEIRKEKNI